MSLEHYIGITIFFKNRASSSAFSRASNLWVAVDYTAPCDRAITYKLQWVFAYPIKPYKKIGSVQMISINWLKACKTVTNGQKFMHLFWCHLPVSVSYLSPDIWLAWMKDWFVSFFPNCHNCDLPLDSPWKGKSHYQLSLITWQSPSGTKFLFACIDLV